MTERFSLVIIGATGFTGKNVVTEANRIAKNDKSITWAIAGRSQSKLEKIINDLQTKTGDDLTNIKIIIADIEDADSLKDMSRQAKVVLNCCGPYRFYGEPIVKACIETQTHYVDVSGEPAFMEKMQLAYDEAAQKAGVYVVSACGMDSIPADLGILFIEQNFKGQVNSIETYLNLSLDSNYKGSTSGTGHYATWESLIHGFSEQKELGPLRRQLFPEKLPETLPKLKARSIIHKSEHENFWCVPFHGSDRSVVYRTQRFLYKNENKRPVQLLPYFAFSNFSSVVMLMFFGMVINTMAKFEYGRKIMLKYPELFSCGQISHEGPSDDYMNNIKMSMLFCAEGWDELDDINETLPTKKMKAKITTRNPAYGATCTMLIYSAITIIKEADKIPGNGGVLSPGAAFSKTNLIKNLNENGIIFEIVKCKL